MALILSESSPLITISDPIYTISESLPRQNITIVEPKLMIAPIRPEIDITSDNYILQKKITDYLYYRILDKWLYEKDLCTILKYIKVKNGSIIVLTNKKEIENNAICNDSIDDIEKKSDYIEKHILTKDKMKDILMDIINILKIKWYNLINDEKIVVHTVKKYLKHKFKDRMD